MTSTPALPGAVPGEPDSRVWSRLILHLLDGSDLDRRSAAWAMDQVMSGSATPVQLAGFLVALRSKGETVEELSGLVDVMLANAVRIEVPGPAVDVVGTGGDRSHSVNISTMAALVVAGAGRRVVKHGNRAASSASGAADVLEALGVRLDLSPARVAEVGAEVGITFCFAQVFHPAFRHAAPARSGLGIPTAFNLLGPLTNPAQPVASAVGVADPRTAPLMAGVFAARNTSALVFRGDDGLDELSTIGPSQVWQVHGGTVLPTRVDALDLGLPRATIEDLRGGDPQHNAAVARALLGGHPGPVRDAVLLNSAAALVALDRSAVAPGAEVRDLGEALSEALEVARESVDSGAAAHVLDRWVTATAA